MSDAPGLGPLELDALKELMNIGFGRAAAALSEVIDLRVHLSVPTVTILEAGAVPDFLRAEVESGATYTMVEEAFFGRFEGVAYFLLPSGEGTKLRRVLGLEEALADLEYGDGGLEEEAVQEIGNIIIGACVGKMAELLHDHASFQPPRTSGTGLDATALLAGLGRVAGLALVFRTLFHFQKEDLAGHLFLVASPTSLPWVRQSVAAFLRDLQ